MCFCVKVECVDVTQCDGHNQIYLFYFLNVVGCIIIYVFYTCTLITAVNAPEIV